MFGLPTRFYLTISSQRMRQGLLCGLCCLLPLLASAADVPPIKRITVIETSNHRLDRGANGLALPGDLAAPEIVALREYISPHLKLEGDREFDLLRAIARLVHANLTHSTLAVNNTATTALEMFKAAGQGQAYSCVEYSRILRDMLHAQGIPARSVSLLSKDIAYGGLGSSHVLVEAWSNQFDKWLILDAQFGLYAERDGQPMNVYELYEAQARGEFAQVQFRPLSKHSPAAAVNKTANEYRAFIAGYLGYMTAQMLADEERVPVLLRLHGRDWPLTSQGLARKAHIVADDRHDMYFGINHSSVLLEFRREAQPINQQQVLIESADEYRAKMAQFAAVPDFDVTPHNNMPWFSYYEYRVDDGGWQVLKAEQFRWRLREGMNALALRAVNQAGRRGPATMMKIRYAP